MQIKAAFFDRDGTIIEDVGYLSNLSTIALRPSALSICRLLYKADYKIIIVTNQSGVARNYFDETFVKKSNAFIYSLLAKEGIEVLSFYYCPHHPTLGDERYRIKCDCRKPSPGMLHKAAKEHNIELQNSLLFGDQESDLAAGAAAGVGGRYLIQEVERYNITSYKSLKEALTKIRNSGEKNDKRGTRN